MTLEPSEVELRSKVNRIIHTQKHLAVTHKTLTRKKQEELDSLSNKVNQDPLMTIQLKQSTIESIRDFSATSATNHGVGGLGITYDQTVSRMITLAQSAIAHGLGDK